jgi:hypothetical protein
MRKKKQIPEAPMNEDEEFKFYKEKMNLAEQRLGYLETLFRNVSGDKRQKARQRLLARTIKQQKKEVTELRTVVHRLENRRKDLATRYVKPTSETSTDSKRDDEVS